MPKKAAVRSASPSSKPFWIGFDLGGTKMLACVLDENYQVLGTARKSTQGTQGAVKGLKRIVTTIEEAILAAGVDRKNLQGIGIGCPGTVNSAKGILLHAPNLGWNRVSLGPNLTRALGCPVMILNDVDAGTYGEYTLGAGRGSRSLLGVFPGTGLGAGFVYDGRIVQGRNVSCMELGNLWLPGTHLGSEKPGAVLLEDLTSRLGIASAASVECYRGKSPALEAKTGAALKEMKSKALTGSYKAGEPGTVAVFDNSLHFLGMGIAMVVNLLGPDHITLGGGLVEEMPAVYLRKLREHVAHYSMPEIFAGVKFSVAKLGGNAVAIGSAAWLRNQPS
ncbi:ROK family protein [Verrucomicrobium sp. BvORR106]|uniref:ROK family protein n=1 Tax=Verrucomicrobium sp. BvORR106 TaxID=1403819 RepID=UPI00068A4530|nr:ROK family protein [Verrucomicrobium sp. BvORR106]